MEPARDVIGQEGNVFEFHAKRLVVAALTQLYSYMMTLRWRRVFFALEKFSFSVTSLNIQLCYVIICLFPIKMLSLIESIIFVGQQLRRNSYVLFMR